MAEPKTPHAEEFLPTRESLLERLKNLEDQKSWSDFFETYWKLIYSVARRTGLSDAEAQDVVQETIISVSRKIEGFAYDPSRGSFKAWLKRLTQWRVADFVRKKQYQVRGQRLPKEEALNTTLAEQQEDPARLETEKAWDEEWEKHLYELALQRVKQQVEPRQFQLFYFHVCKEYPASRVAEQLEVNQREVYTAKTKLSSMIEREVRELEKQVK